LWNLKGAVVEEGLRFLRFDKPFTFFTKSTDIYTLKKVLQNKF
jgi:hypothetical protein